MVLEILGSIAGVGGCAIKLVDHGAKLAAAEEDMIAANTFLCMISDAAESLRFTRDELLPHLTFNQKQQIQSILFQTDHHLHTARRALNRRFIAAGEGAMLGFSDRLHWVLKDKGTMINHQMGLLCLFTSLSAKHTELEIVRIIHIDHKPDPTNHLDVIAPNHARSSIATGPKTYTTTSNMGDNVMSQKYDVAIEEEPKRDDKIRCVMSKIEDFKPKETEIELELPITTFLKRKYTERAMREITSQPVSQPASMSIEVQFSITTALTKRYTEKAKKNNTDARSNLDFNFWKFEKGGERTERSRTGYCGY